MSSTSAIEWTDATWNPVRGCTKISPGCAHCYAETFAERFRGVEGHPYEQGFDLRLAPDKLDAPLHWKKPRMIFVNSMSDLFHEEVPDEYIDKVFAVMALAHWHTFQVLTKRAERMRDYMKIPNRKRLMAATVMGLSNDLAAKAGTHEARIKLDDFSAAFKGNGPFPNVWLGVSIENKKHGWPRVYDLRHTPAAVRFFSVEPLLEDVTPLRLDGIHWVIVGGESGPGARPMHPDWPMSIRDQCIEAGVPFFFKQWGEWQNGSQIGAHNRIVHNTGRIISEQDAAREHLDERTWHAGKPTMMSRVGKKAAGRILDGRTWDEMPETKAVPA